MLPHLWKYSMYYVYTEISVDFLIFDSLEIWKDLKKIKGNLRSDEENTEKFL